MEMEVEYLEDDEAPVSLESVEQIQSNLQTGVIQILDADSDSMSKDADRSRNSVFAK